MAKKKKSPKPTLRKPSGEKVKMSGALERITKLQEQMDAARNEALEEIREKRKEHQRAINELDAQEAEITGEKRRKRAEGTRRCKICVSQGKSGEGHNARGHKKWLADQKG